VRSGDNFHPTRVFACGLSVVLVCCLGALGEPTTKASGPRRIAVLPLKNDKPGDGMDWVGDAAAGTIITMVSELRGILVVERAQVDRVMDERDLAEADVTEPAPAAKLGKLVSAEAILIGSYVKDEGTMVFNVGLVDVNTSVVLETVHVESGLAALPAINKLADSVVRSLAPAEARPAPSGGAYERNSKRGLFGVRPVRFGAEVDMGTGKVRRWAFVIVHHAFAMPMFGKPRDVPILTIHVGAPNSHDPKDRQTTMEVRAKAIARDLLKAFALLDRGAKLAVLPVDQRPPGRGHPGLFVVSADRKKKLCRILTVYKDDVDCFPRMDSQMAMAAYLKDVVSAHYLLFWRRETDIREYEKLALDRTGAGKVFKEIMIKAIELARLKGRTRADASLVRDALGCISDLQQRTLATMAHVAPVDYSPFEQ